MANILARAAALYGDKHGTTEGYTGLYVIQTQSYGPEARGGASRADVRISDSRIRYPKVDYPDILAVMSEKAYVKYIDGAKDDTLLFIDPDTVMSRPTRHRFYLVPATRTARDMKRPISANMVMLGGMCSITQIISEEAIINAIKDAVPSKTVDFNIELFQKGVEISHDYNSASKSSGL
jgi:2-oxoglutarate ferredoxin oxidoreductase subunit gamma